MRQAGLDVGSRSIELVICENGEVAVERRVDTTYDPLSQMERLLDGVVWDVMAATGYGRGLAAERLGATSLTEIRAHARGVHHVFPAARTVLDIGGQDTKVISLSPDGRVVRFEMNDRCAAGTGKFLEFMATGLQVSLEEFGEYALEGTPGTTINSMCTVFAESEATSLMSQGTRGEDIALALHESIVRRSIAMARRVGLEEPVAFCGGVALNACVRSLLDGELAGDLLVPERPDMVGALGAALLAG